ncbi:MAG: phospho-N-acetylmuramoyl-pentapeptide-transferase [Coriobacteriia bacterium]|nr:phospho-N-acetylmuramoyl-pentapeptide-transferase [Coriobacteriia bacterium]
MIELSFFEGSANYPTYQVFIALFISALITAFLMPFWIKLLTYRKIGQQVRVDGPLKHLIKQGTPTMGGVIILFATLLTSCVFTGISPEIVIIMLTTFLFGVLGFVDDISKVAHQRSLGLSAKAKIVWQFVISIAFCLIAVNKLGIKPVLMFPGIPYSIDLGIWTSTIMGIEFPWLYMIFIFLLIGGFSNAFNLNDGLDGLAAGNTMIVMGVMAMIAFRNDQLSLAIFAAACAGACIGFLWFNSYPANIFMGDTGSLALGGGFAALAVLTKTEVVSIVIGATFIIEALSVIIQVISFKLTRKRVFLMAPIHHHFEQLGWSETKVVIRFWIVTAAFAALGFALYFQLNSLLA